MHELGFMTLILTVFLKLMSLIPLSGEDINEKNTRDA